MERVVVIFGVTGEPPQIELGDTAAATSSVGVISEVSSNLERLAGGPKHIAGRISIDSEVGPGHPAIAADVGNISGPLSVGPDMRGATGVTEVGGAVGGVGIAVVADFGLDEEAVTADRNAFSTACGVAGVALLAITARVSRDAFLAIGLVEIPITGAFHKPRRDVAGPVSETGAGLTGLFQDAFPFDEDVVGSAVLAELAGITRRAIADDGPRGVVAGAAIVAGGSLFFAALARKTEDFTFAVDEVMIFGAFVAAVSGIPGVARAFGARFDVGTSTILAAGVGFGAGNNTSALFFDFEITVVTLGAEFADISIITDAGYEPGGVVAGAEFAAGVAIFTAHDRDAFPVEVDEVLIALGAGLAGVALVADAFDPTGVVLAGTEFAADVVGLGADFGQQTGLLLLVIEISLVASIAEGTGISVVADFGRPAEATAFLPGKAEKAFEALVVGDAGKFQFFDAQFVVAGCGQESDRCKGNEKHKEQAEWGLHDGDQRRWYRGDGLQRITV